MIRPLSSHEHDSTLATGLNVLVFRVAENQACQQFQAELEEFARRHPACGVWTVEAMQQRDLADRHGLRALPTIVIYRDGLPARRFTGSMGADDLGKEVDEVAAADLEEEFNAWVLGLLETGDAGSPFIDSRPWRDRRGAGPTDPGRLL
jgi:thioredoxin-like negative regulator of GroEL